MTNDIKSFPPEIIKGATIKLTNKTRFTDFAGRVGRVAATGEDLWDDGQPMVEIALDGLLKPKRGMMLVYPWEIEVVK